MNGVDAIAGFKNWALETSRGAKSPTSIQHLNKEMLIVGMSAGALSDDMAGAFMKGMHHFLPKPVTQDQMVAVLKIKKNSSSIESARDKLDELASVPDDVRKAKPKKQPRPSWDAAAKIFSSVPSTAAALFGGGSSASSSARGGGGNSTRGESSSEMEAYPKK
jgi:CheY-like chemotaxis protein